jgi:hypothetical protein
MRFTRAAIVLVFASCVVAVYAATEVSFTLSATTGDKDFDLTLRSINTEAQQSLPSFYASMDLNYGTRAADIDALLYRYRLSPADAYMVIRFSVLIGKPIDYVMVRYHKHRKKGWGVIARELGIKPGSPEFHRLKEGGVVVLERSRKDRSEREARGYPGLHPGGPENDHHGGDAGKHEGHGGEGKGRGRGKR